MFDIFQYDFMLRAFLAGVLVALIAPSLGIFLVVRRYAHLADTLSHVSLLGVALGVFAGLHPVLGAFLVSMAGVLSLELLRMQKRLEGEMLSALFLFSSLALAVVLLNLAQSPAKDLLSFLFGSIATVTSSDLKWLFFSSVLILSIIFLFYKEFFLISFDEELASADGVHTRLFNILLMFLASLAISLSMRIVGVLLIGALMVIPVLSAFQFRRGFKHTLIISLVFSLFSVIIGLFLSYYFNLAAGGAIVTTSLIFFLLSLSWDLVKR